MTILLLNDNPVVSKLVTLSAQKTSDELDVIDSLDNISKDSYDLLVIDDTVYQDDILNEINKKITYSKSLFICSRDTKAVDGFDSVMKKPFLPTDLVELFSSISKEVELIDLSNKQDDEDEITLHDDFGDLDDDFGDDIDLGAEIPQSVLDSDEAQKVKELLDETNDELEDLDDELDLSDIDLNIESEEEIPLDDELDLELEDSLDLEEEATDEEETIEDEIPLDDELDLELEDSLDLEEEATVAEEDALEEEIPLDDELDDELELELEDGLDLEEEATVAEEDDLEEEIPLDDELELELEDSLDLEDETTVAEEDALEEEIPLDDVNIEDQIKTAMSELSEEELEEEVSEDTLLKIAQNEIDPLDSLNSKDLKLAIGEEVEEEEIIEDSSEDEIEEVPLEDDLNENVPSADGVEALKNLLNALNDKNVAASMKGMKISINITLGDN